ncbi:MAG: 5'/3'-nucleotidase SurE [Acidobacteriota bacterium]
MPSILLTNDDGYGAPGLMALERALAGLGEVTVVAPDRERSSASHALTLHRPLRVRSRGARHFVVDGTPTDCVYLGVVLPLVSRPDLVVAGINCGLNVGDDVTYSGTVAAAFEAALLGVPAFAVSRDSGHGDAYAAAAELASEVARHVLDRGLPPDTILNVNTPGAPPRGVRFTRQGKRVYTQSVVERRDPRGSVYYWIGGEPTPISTDPDSDLAAILQGYAAITPLKLDLTDQHTLEQIAAWSFHASARAGE